ncbi:hypothetical protein [Amycolatopsis anabasis]|uniref:hypothetical protein n=1 Tax=Amycolatopsis anabasis TaxID=1840409 RepID=UPI00131D485F|nr:hypothetical protein [Amycolatopsis anabasis]
MSPVSRGRKSKKKPKGATPRTKSVYGEVLRDFVPLVSETDPLQVELHTSDLVGSWWLPGVSDEPERSVGLDLIRYAAGKATPAALALLRALAVLGATEAQREQARAGAERLAARGLAEPVWAGALEDVTFTEAWHLADVYEEEATLLLVFAHAGRPHGLIVDLDLPNGPVSLLYLTDNPDAALDSMRDEAEESDGIQVLERIPAPRARRFVESGLALAEVLPPPDRDGDFAATRALALARCRILPPPEPAPEPREYTEAERTALVDEFFAAGEIGDGETARSCARLIVRYGCDEDLGRPLRMSPDKAMVMLHDWLAEELPLDAPELPAMREALPAWTRWAARRSDLPEAAVEELVEEIGELVQDYPEDLIEARNFPLDSYLDGDESGETIERRRFAVPFEAVTLAGDDVDPADPADRRRAVIAEHPEFGDEPDERARLFLTVKEVLVNQLWTDDPPEAWDAAQRLLDTGKDRDEVLHELALVLAGHLAGKDHDLDAYKTELRQLG